MHMIKIRQSLDTDMPAIERLYPAAFPDEDLLPLVKRLLAEEPDILSLVAEKGQSIAGHILFTLCGLSHSSNQAALLAPLAVAPGHQRQGIGTALIREGLQQLGSKGVDQVFVLGDPAYYGRCGFDPETAVAPPYPLPEQWRQAWQSLSIGPAQTPNQGKLLLPELWLQPALWAP
ncbi:GNAT family N-acetyltransferase [Hoeflea sp.]|uniref:GNAT family N-acetyltransferase n=1 Tax=Hoeflea sp. TaxID=1940281 RepID=UPI003A8E1887